MPGAPPNPNIPGVAHGGPVEVAIVRAAAARHNISSQTLWGVYGTESNFGHNAVNSSAGACCYFQFMPATAKSLGVKRGDFTSEAYGAAKYLDQLGADDNPESTATTIALNKYNGNGGGSTVTKYVQDVRTHGKAITRTNIPGVDQAADVAGAAVDAATAPVAALADFVGLLGQSATWFRIGKVGVGLLLLGTGIIVLVVAGGKQVANSPVGRVATKVTPAGRIAGAALK